MSLKYNYSFCGAKWKARADFFVGANSPARAIGCGLKRELRLGGQGRTLFSEETKVSLFFVFYLFYHSLSWALY